MKRVLYFTFLAISTLLYQCSNSQKLLSDGNYEKSYKVSLKEIKKGKASKSDIEILNASLEHIYEQNIESILEAENGERLDDGAAAYDGYDELESKFADAVKYLNVKNNELYIGIVKSKEKLGGELYQDFKNVGLQALQVSRENGDRGAGQVAYENFEFAQQYNSTTEIADLLDEAYGLAVTILVVETRAPYNPSFDYDIEREFKRVENIDTKFQQAFYKRNHDNADCIIEITFDRFDFQNNFNSYTREYSRDVDVSRVITNSEGQAVTISETERVSCILTVNQYLSGLGIFADIQVKSKSKYCNSSRDNYQDFFEAPYEEYQVSGDRRALPPEFNRNSNGERLRDSELVEILVRRFYNNFAVEYF